MARTKIHRLQALFKAGIITVENLPLILLQQSNRHNFERGYYKNQLNKKVEKQFKKDAEY